jgi:hypothetical protein
MIHDRIYSLTNTLIQQSFLSKIKSVNELKIQQKSILPSHKTCPAYSRTHLGCIELD